MRRSVQEALGAGYAALKKGEYATARRCLDGVDDPQAIHLRALVEKQAGNVDQAWALLLKAAQALPDDADVANNQGNVARLRGDDARAEAAYLRALELRPGFLQASTAYGRLLIDHERWDEALAWYEPLLVSAAGQTSVVYGAATVLLAQGQLERAERLLGQIVDAGDDRAEVRFMRGRVRAERGQANGAIEDLRYAFERAPTLDTLKTLAGQHWLMGQSEAFRDLLTAAARSDGGLGVVAADLLRQSGAPDECLELLRQTSTATQNRADAWAVTAMAHIDLGDAMSAERAADECLALDRAHDVGNAQRIVALLMQGKGDEALDDVQRMRAAEPKRQHWIAYEATALRVLDRSVEYRELVNLDKFVQVYPLAVPEGYASLEAFNAEFASVLNRWHRSERHPLNQSLRSGTQTPRDVLSIAEPVVGAFRQAIDEPIRRYLSSIGTSAAHPLTARNRGQYRVQSCWSVRLSEQGFHVNHVHPEGWISSAYYVSVPASCREDDAARAGWIKFAEPPFVTRPLTEAQKWVRPQAGLLVLFPSYLWHGTEPIRDAECRLTAPFDLVPG